MLPVNCRLSYLQIERPDAICCAYGCGSVETEHHAFHACASIYPIWSFHANAWGHFGVNFAWSSITQLDHFPTNARGAADKDVLQLLWHLFVAATLHLVWREHNEVQYEGKVPLPELTWREITFLAWTSSVRRWLRLQDAD
jgi:hypothetical protein